MQFLSPLIKPALTRDPKVIANERPAGAHLPYARHLDDSTIQTRDGTLMQTIRLGGLLFETADSDELNYRAELRDAMLRTLGSSRFAIYHHVIRRRADVTLDSDYVDDFSQKLDLRWRERLSAKHLYINELFLTIIRRPLQGQIGLAERVRGWFAKSSQNIALRLATEKHALDSAREALMASLSAYDPQLLSRYESDSGERSEPIEFLSYLFNGDMRPVATPHGDIGHHIPTRRASFGQEAIELAPSGPLERRFVALVSIKDYPGQTMPGMFDELYRLPFEINVSQSFAFVERRQALGRMNLALRRMRSAEDEALSLRHELTNAKDEVAAGRAGFGEHHTTIAIHADNLTTLDTQVAEVIALMADLGINAVREDIALEPAFWSQFPGNFRYLPRRGLVSTTNFAGLASLHNFPVGKVHGNHWGEAVTLFETTAAGPYFFNFHQKDLGNFTIIGPSGSGKTVVLNFLLAQAQKFRPRTIFFDKDRGAELFIRAIGGNYDRLDPAFKSGLNPLQLRKNAANAAFLQEWLTLLVGEVTSAEQEQLKDALEANFAQPKEMRQLRHFAELCRGQDRPTPGDLYSRLKPWFGDGEHAWLFDNPKDITDLTANTVGFDMTAILDHPVARTPAMLYFFHRVEQRLDGNPTILVIDEGWKALDDPVFVRKIKDWEKTIRKRNGIVGFATQSAQDALESQIASAIIEQAATQIFMINPKARAEDYIQGFGLSPHEFELVKSLPDNSHCFLIKHGKESVVARLDLSGEQELLTILSGRESTVRLFDELVGKTGTDPANWMHLLLEKAA
ncbi:VirB4 family type IV secretion system protein [Pontixanthobacter aestiaquae]|uniref:Type IV secretion system protein virB4 n=1 Tax=Pontixanthobacter aestiaquae TaxID=1509367 RepID=A0A844ZBT4_9SPHN|nr:VirB4 family type IV secretion system protein [Pontixanthobacter aestiaquae]MDN3644623.1 VirB4 family type IV secretion system protein [Pontixanthobacter aestiaquae]MXO84370.1 VirB4 family type IV secretion/conjugal transfer ATPase [Pontixanthobacter aestiaquae]